MGIFTLKFVVNSNRKTARFFVCLNQFLRWFVVNSACAKCGKGKLIDHFAFAEGFAR